MIESDINDIKALLAGCMADELTIGIVDKGSHEANAEFIRGCFAFEASTEIYCVVTKEHSDTTGKFIAFTGNGPHGKGHAAFFMHAKRIIEALLEERAQHLRTIGEAIRKASTY